ncbi:sel1 repeat family protein [Sphingosinicellaceae bacterium]|nr:sel1 repeat family protein [Sphingosinicellaceae bacterium]
MLRLLIILLLAAPAAAFAAPPRWAMAVLSDGLDAHARRDYSRARADFLRLAAQGSAIAETMLGVMTSEGHGSRRDLATAATWWLRAANRGYAPAQLAVAEAFTRGEGVARDPGSAWVWARLAATHGDDRTAAAAKLLAARLAPGFDAPTLAKLDRRRLAWRPWATLAL